MKEEITENKITSVKSLLNILEDINNKRQEQEDNSEFFYRGQSNKDWDISPSIFRNKEWLKNEHKLYKDLRSTAPKEFDDHLTTFAKLTKMQHYSLPTRLLDISVNPLVALYFACQKHIEKKEYKGNSEKQEHRLFWEEETDGEIFIIEAYSQYSDMQKVKILSHLGIFEKKVSTLKDFYNYLIGNNVLTKEYSRIYNLVEVLKSRVIVKPELRNKRIKQQGGAFILFGTKFDEEEIKGINKENRDEVLSLRLDRIAYDVKEDYVKPREERYIIPADKKEDILEELSFMGINDAGLFPDLENQATYIKNKYLVEIKIASIKKEKKALDKDIEKNQINFDKRANVTVSKNKQSDINSRTKINIRKNNRNLHSDLDIDKILKKYNSEEEEVSLKEISKDIKVNIGDILGPDWSERQMIKADLRRFLKRLIRKHKAKKVINVDSLFNDILNYQKK